MQIAIATIIGATLGVVGLCIVQINRLGEPAAVASNRRHTCAKRHRPFWQDILTEVWSLNGLIRLMEVTAVLYVAYRMTCIFLALGVTPCQ